MIKILFYYKIFSLRKPKSEDAGGFIDICADKEVMRYYGCEGAFINTFEDANKQIDWCNKQFENNAGKWIIVEQEKDTYIGDIGFFNFVEEHRRVELGYRLKKEYWGKGIISNFIAQLVKYGFTKKNYNRIEATVDERNFGSKRVLLKNGFKLEGILREFEFEFNEFVNLEVYSILKREFTDIKSHEIQ
ncbi:GNAT family N-acetyltransferase [candidate division WOR-3 bacterium]|nr:GNAT family N-acetyltransferase [candidate division WOR-3 bacterium]